MCGNVVINPVVVAAGNKKYRASISETEKNTIGLINAKTPIFFPPRLQFFSLEGRMEEVCAE